MVECDKIPKTSEIVNADCFISIVLSNVEKCNFPTLNKLRDSLQNLFPDIVINLSRSAMQEAINYYSAYYSFSHEFVKRNVPKEILGLPFIKREFSSDVSWSVIEAVDKCVKKNIHQQ
ncbi:MAG: hypothetical protein JXB88_04575 [Spirochaetales bacterium]|nr:hypothetical protein [Spirochaetales bacterium]